MSNQDGSEDLVALSVEGPNPASELAIYDYSLKLKKSGVGRIEARLPSGLYDIEASIANRRERKTIALRGPLTVGASEWDLKARTAAPLSSELPARDVHEEKAKEYSHTPTMVASTHAGECRLFVFLRTIRRDDNGALKPPEQRFWSGFKLCSAHGDLICDFANGQIASQLENGWCALTVDLAGGGYVLSGPGPAGKDFCIPLWLQSRFETQLFVPVGDGHPLFDAITLAMAPRNEGFGAAGQRPTEFAAALLAGFRRGENPVNPELVRGMLENKLRDPFAAIVAAHGLLRMERPDTGLFLDIVAALRESLGDHPDVVALELMSPQPVSGAALKFPPILRLSFDGVLSRSASNSEIIEVNTLISEVLGTLVAGQYVLWLRDPADKSKLVTMVKHAFWGAVTLAPGLLKIFKNNESPMVNVDLDSLVSAFESWLRQQNPDGLAARLRLPRTIIDGAMTSLKELLPAAHRITQGSLRNIELPASLVDSSSMSEAFLGYLFSAAAAAAKLSPLHRRVISLIVQCWQVFGEGRESAREVAQYQRRLAFLANTVSKARELLSPNNAARDDAFIVICILSGLAARLYPLLLVGCELEIVAEAGAFAEITGAKGRFVGHVSATPLGSVLEQALKKCLRGTRLSSAKAGDFTSISVRDGISMDFMRINQSYWTAAINMADLPVAADRVIEPIDPDAIERRWVRLAKAIDQDCAKLVELVRVAIDPLAPTRPALESLPGEIGSLRTQLQQRISSDTPAD